MLGKASRQEKIVQAIRRERISSLAQLQAALLEEGIEADISTLSRDINEIRVGKRSGCYQLPEEYDLAVRILPPLGQTLKSFVTDLERVGNIVVVRTLPGGANAVAIQIDSRSDELNCAGTIAGDDTVFVLVRDQEDARRFVAWFEESLEQDSAKDGEDQTE